MRSIVLVLVMLAGQAATADDVICVGGRCLLPRPRATTVVVQGRPSAVVEAAPVAVETSPAVTVVAPQARRVTVGTVSAEEHACRLASTGGFSHCSNYGGGAEGLGFSTSSPDDAVRRCCFWGQRRPREIATAWCPRRRGWVAVVRYE